MTFRPVDMQVSMPRSVELTSLQQQQQQRPTIEQGLLGQQAMKTAEQEAARSAKTEAASHGTVSERQPRERKKGYPPSSKKSSQEQSEEENKAPEHPYKGRHIDFMG